MESGRASGKLAEVDGSECTRVGGRGTETTRGERRKGIERNVENTTGIIKVLYTNADSIVNRTDTHKGRGGGILLGASHHTMIMVEVVIPSKSNETSELVPDYRRADFDAMCEKTGAIDWRTQLEPLNAQDSWKLFKETVTSIVDACIPKKNPPKQLQTVMDAEECHANYSEETSTLETLLFNK